MDSNNQPAKRSWTAMPNQSSEVGKKLINQQSEIDQKSLAARRAEEAKRRRTTVRRAQTHEAATTQMTGYGQSKVMQGG